MTENKILDSLRRKIDGVDDRILALLNERARHVQRIGALKARSGAAVVAANREHEILERLAQANPGPLPAEAVEEIFTAVIHTGRLLQKRLTVAYFGPEATYTHQAALRQFGKGAECHPVKTIADVFEEVEKGRVEYGVVPIENSTEGVVNLTLDTFMDSDLVICAERADRISHNLLSSQDSLKKIKGIASHPQALAQCRKWLEANLPGVPVYQAASTADAAHQAALHADMGAIAGSLAGELYRLKTLATHIEDAKHNMTRFWVLGKHVPPSSGTGREKTSLLVVLSDRVGALHELLGIFRAAKINLTKIESRPSKRKAWEYVFFIDFLGHAEDPRLKPVLGKIAKACVVMKVLGSYPRAA
jgi:chorismate mutase/prephenate dehydratase